MDQGLRRETKEGEQTSQRLLSAGSKDERRKGRAGGTIWGETVRSANTNERTRTRAEQMLSGWVL